jgi:beta-lactamase regulating signal transducer with metallopeptidase domain
MNATLSSISPSAASLGLASLGLATLGFTLVKVTAVLLAAGGVATLLRDRSAAARHDAWAAGLLAALALGALAPFAPTLEVAVLASQDGSVARGLPGALGAQIVGEDRRVLAAEPAAGARDPIATPLASDVADPASSALPPAGATVPWSVVLAVWAFGTAALLVRFAAGLFGLRRLRRDASPLRSASWQRLLDEAQTAAGAGPGVRLLGSSAVATPVTWGWRRPVVLLPADAEAWPESRRRAALLHELAHVARRDALTQLLGTLACAVYWFHPAAWMAFRALRRESERACDDRVLAAGAPAEDYAAQLLAVARSAAGLRRGGPALAIGMARASTLEGRLLAVLDARLPRAAVGRRTRVAVAVGIGALLMPLAGLTAVARAGSEAKPYVRLDAGSVARSVAGAVAPGSAAEPRTAPSTPESRAVAAAAAATPGCTSEGGDRLECAVDAAPGGTLELDLEVGAEVTIVGWDQPRVELRADLEAEDPTRHVVELVRDGNRVTVSSRLRGGSQRRSWSSSHAYSLRVPRNFDVTIRSSGGALAIEDVEGTFRGRIGGGGLSLRRVRGRAELATGGGEIEVTDSTLEGSVRTGGGRALLSRVRGGLDASSGSGPVIRADAPEGAGDDGGGSASLDALEIDDDGEDIAIAEGAESSVGRLHIQRSGGEIRLRAAPAGADVRTGGGDIEIGSGGGLVEAVTGGGDIEVGPVAGSVHARTGAGEVIVRLADAGGEPQTVEVESGFGRVVVELPAGFAGEVDVETAYYRGKRVATISTPWSLESETSDWVQRRQDDEPHRTVRTRGAVGHGGDRLIVRTVGGDVVIRTAGGSPGGALSSVLPRQERAEPPPPPLRRRCRR